MRHALAVALSFSILAGAAISVAQAQTLPTRTWVSATGNDANACSRTAPCLTFQGAYNKTAAGGEIDVLDPGGFGGLTINKSITIDGRGQLAGVTTTAGNAIYVNAGNDDIVILRNLSIRFGGASGVLAWGVAFQNGRQLIIENTTVSGFTASGVLVGPGGAGAGNLTVVISNSTIASTVGSGDGIRTSFGNTTVSHSVITGNSGFGLIAEGTGVINADSNVLTGNSVAVQAGNGGSGQTAATVRLSNNDVYRNLTGFGCGGGVLATAGNNRKGSNAGGGVPACSPNATISQQ